jgi:hypothetical protein
MYDWQWYDWQWLTPHSANQTKSQNWIPPIKTKEGISSDQSLMSETFIDRFFALTTPRELDNADLITPAHAIWDYHDVTEDKIK